MDEHADIKKSWKKSPWFSHAKAGLSTLGIIAGAVSVALIIVVYIIQFYHVDGPSMEAELHHRDRLLVVKIPRTLARLTGHDYIPRRYDIIIFERPHSAATKVRESQLIKRVIGLPGDRIVINDNKVTIYNNDHPDGFNPDEGQDYAGWIYSTSGNQDITVPTGQIFVLGDNRANSTDSRELGPIPAKNIIGKTWLRVVPDPKKF
jgi:signal peptidase I